MLQTLPRRKAKPKGPISLALFQAPQLVRRSVYGYGFVH